MTSHPLGSCGPPSEPAPIPSQADVEMTSPPEAATGGRGRGVTRESVGWSVGKHRRWGVGIGPGPAEFDQMVLLVLDSL